MKDTPIVVVSRDTDVFILLAYAFSKTKPANKWYMKIDNTRYVDIEKVVRFLGDELSLILPQLHALTGCYTTSYLYGVGKVKVLRKCMKNPAVVGLIESKGKTMVFSESEEEQATRFIQTMCYNGQETESMTDTKVRLYKKMKTKSSQSFPPDKLSLKQALLRVHHQVYYWLRFHEYNVAELDMHDFGWQIDMNRMVIPKWFVGPQLPPSMGPGKEKELGQPETLKEEPVPKQPRLEVQQIVNLDEEASGELEFIYFGESDDDGDNLSDSDYEDYI